MDYNFLIKTALFNGLDTDDARKMVDCLCGRTKRYKKGAFIYHTGDLVKALGIILSGNIIIEQTDAWGRQTILDTLGAGQIFAETYACVASVPIAVNVTASQDCEILFLEAEKVMKTCPSSCPFHNHMIHNLLSATTAKNLMLTQKISIISCKSIREKLLAYLSYQAVINGQAQFYIPFNRQQLADYLCTERSALSNELGKMQKEGLITFHKNSFQLNIC